MEILRYRLTGEERGRDGQIHGLKNKEMNGQTDAP
jgi:hypothetical protein